MSNIFLELQDGDKTVYTHTSLIEESKQEQIQAIYDKVPQWTNGGRFLGFWLSMEAVNRVQSVAKLPIYYRAGIVATSTLLGGLVSSLVFWKSGNENQVAKLANGAPVYLKKWEVPELSKLYFFLDDDNNFKPSLNHHAVTQGRQYYKIYQHN
ncbi:hypothetical protein TTHERM_00825290 (macronuclear) [Tetrahymena thermophila SB210]|uniref:Uncharacterized protein n=1 Tax=Tetrahymena thermophila (strain SB210) TaxID=312017 RepID=I7LZE5_TETTS|nr:hypothetical protein TTHERM_00825290 [Tetrahymena thermophila SB210]6YNX_P Chain P, ATPTT10 [Tetrahymena thermophila]6YNX_p Chain p, ATPTT10 [Tetrahymena thermophila]6YNY_P Chain P, ATPTT10 [Tetrahymena thermophila]6YNY_p Chain p, ATPTT10 [Tetrahymena thermophila]6YNZ_P Chain P, ATPTT10 [Tetrahymena thermophila]6YNZ_P3 Chain P3, ATPTT10 [Tetrahymena thermophila]6YNZ_p Chain p, ATPTT10 [Tetrahymena thermophila]6YNZ_p3 Chain p3, ATPTT10 [Tetrahymena thermophila]EAR83734.2 hypothetical pro|eukprot:XP_001031397.2 hypothetical protein TTHERM_00825290 [Tetrahymena thermophila SB210]